MEAQTATTTEAAETTAPAADTQKPKKTSAESTEKKPAETSKKKKPAAETSRAADADKPEADSSEPPAVESLVDDKTGFFSDKVVDILGKNKKQILSGFTYNEDYMVEKEPDKEEILTLHYVVDNDKKYAFTFEFEDDKLTEVTCESIIKNFNTALSAAKSMSWIKDESKTEKGKRVYKVPGKKTVYTIFKTRDEEDGSAFITQSYALNE